MSNRFKNFIQALRSRGFYITRHSDYTWKLNGLIVTMPELLAYGRKELKRPVKDLYYQLQRGL